MATSLLLLNFLISIKDRIFHVSMMCLKTDALAEEACRKYLLKYGQNKNKAKEVNNIESWLFIISKNYLWSAMEKWARNKAVQKFKENTAV